MPAYNESPSPDDTLKRTRERGSTIRSALRALSTAGAASANERARQAAKNLEMLVDKREIKQMLTLAAYADELDAKLASLRQECIQFNARAHIDPDYGGRLRGAIADYVRSPLSSGSFLASGGITT